MNSPLFDMSLYQSGATQSYNADWRDSTCSDPAWDEPDLHPNLENSTTELLEDFPGNCTLKPTMAENETSDSSHVKVEVVEELSPEEEAERQRLELKVERAFHESGKALTGLRSRRLYRSTHKSFEEYCRDRFGFTRAAAYYLISAAEVMDNLISECQQIVDILPTKENQCRPLTKLESEEQAQVWRQAVEQVGGKVPPARIVKDLVMRHLGVVERLKQKHPSSPEFAQGDVVKIRVGKRSPLHPFNGMWGTIEHVGSFSYTVQVSITKDVQQCKGEEMTKIDDEYTVNIRAVARRIEWLVRNFELEPIEYDILANLQRSRCFTPKQIRHLETIEGDHDIKVSPGN